jgi:hypothetical protein
MQIDRKALDGLLALNDKQLMMMINRLVSQSGLDPSQFNIDPKSIASIRSALSGATDEDIAKVVEQYQANMQRGTQKK